MDNKEINEEIIAIWDEHFSGDEKIMAPLLYQATDKHTILFVGFNPSLNLSELKSLSGINNTKDFFLWKNFSKEKIDTFISIEQKAIQSYGRYFNKIEHIAKATKNKWQHIDLFPIRNTKQRETLKYVFADNKKLILNDFAKKCLRVFEKLTAKCSPKMIIVINALSSRIIQKHFADKINSKRYDDLGYDLITINNDCIPIIFSGMISGQRALDNDSLKRLIWITKKADKYAKTST
ncbi:hypothetical protein A2291_06000 [candidate division WOR-1 bacterium RIFOXYB2_FULL_42_35]|uniref:Uracil-DNA glycosylase-like domain-containing protein n=1 Tax=candidate division WOR-1 bacterium RIFOXYC2_FULL_41_25 TaxID=1802586 RepID=A0A1F4TJM0_UNCSA|nr:MAG: hypothetical protein A2247_01660 [candidate division WOR-1 bacterium RIFOXYA2_FULL_41_14]OGC22277.1 MAG: hypothetical protein A2291_06000 [candidate division WOR-1 bacterium RIFOXYB2_FULL_42_35]OGC32896.1 MAG: hypothetical protein A2462_00675 [candidate division WOR-1 bacterium RIFOXYC2_FULL_41_25]